MAINRYDTPAQAEFINTYVPIPFEQLYTLGRDAKMEVDKAIAEQSSALNKWSEFRSPSAVDTDAWNEATLGAVKPVIDKLAANPDLIKTVEGRSMLRSAINNVDTSKLALLQQSRDTLLQRQKVDQELMMKGLYNPEWHSMDYNNYNTLTSGIFNDISPLAYQSIQDLTDPYYKGIQDTYLGKDASGLYNRVGVTKDIIANIADENLSGIMVTPVAQKHMEVYKRQTGANDEQAKEWLRNKVIQDNLRYVREKLDPDAFALLNAKINATRTKAGASEQQTATTLVNKAAQAFGDKAGVDYTYTTKGANNKDTVMKATHATKRDRFEKTFALTNDNPYRNQYVLKTPTSNVSVNDLRMKSAKNIVSTLAVPFGRNAHFINEAELGDRPKTVGLNGKYIYNADNVAGIMTEDYYVNNRMNVDRSNYDWSPEKEKFTNDLVNGSIPGLAVSPSDAFLPMNLSPGTESFSQRSDVYIPVEYLHQIFPKYVKESSMDVDFKYDNLWKDEEFQKFAKEVGLSKVGDTGSLVPRKPMKIDPDSKNTGYEFTDQGILSSDYVGISQAFPGAYVKVSALRPVLTNPLTRDAANQLEAISRKVGTKGTAEVVSRSEAENFIIE